MNINIALIVIGLQFLAIIVHRIQRNDARKEAEKQRRRNASLENLVVQYRDRMDQALKDKLMAEQIAQLDRLTRNSPVPSSPEKEAAAERASPQRRWHELNRPAAGQNWSLKA